MCACSLTVQWARTPPSASWRFDGGREPPRRSRAGSPPRRGRSRSRGGRESPRRRSVDRRDSRDRSRSPVARKDDDLDRVRRDRSVDRDRSRSPLATNGDDREMRKGISSTRLFTLKNMLLTCGRFPTSSPPRGRLGYCGPRGLDHSPKTRS